MNEQPPAGRDPIQEARTGATRWFFHLQDDAASSQSFLDWHRWMNAASEHRKAYESIENTVLRLSRLKEQAAVPSAEEMARDAYDGSMSISEWRHKTAANRSTLFGPLRHTRYSRPTRTLANRLAIAAGLASLVLGGNWLWMKYERAAQLGEFVYETSAGKQRPIELPEGSRITLDADSALSVRLMADRRTLTLERGEAFFQVAKDPTRPFVVRAGSAQVTAIGTAFNVRLTDDRTVVAVTEGKVEFVAVPRVAAASTTKPAAATPPAGTRPKLQALVAAGEGVSYADDGNLQALPAREAPLATSWLEGRRQYRKEPLRYVLADVNRYTGQKIELASDAVGDLEFTGTLNLRNSAAWLRGLSVALPVSVRERDDGVVLLEHE